jgi:hypothetical protein
VGILPNKYCKNISIGIKVINILPNILAEVYPKTVTTAPNIVNTAVNTNSGSDNTVIIIILRTCPTFAKSSPLKIIEGSKEVNKVTRERNEKTMIKIKKYKIKILKSFSDISAYCLFS